MKAVKAFAKNFFGKMMTASRHWRTCLTLICATSAVFVVAAQEPEGPRSRDLRGSASTREFLGLGPAPDAAAAKKGEPLFKQNCATCHGETARGAQGPNLVRSALVLHDEKEREIGPVIQNGRPQAGMPPFPQLTTEDIHDLSEYIKLQIEQAANRGMYSQLYTNLKNELRGDPQKGNEFFRAKCGSCHSSEGDLAKIGAKFPQASLLQSRFLWPTSQGPAHATVSTASGTTVIGILIKLDDFDVAIRDTKGDYRYWPRSEVSVNVVDNLQGHRTLLPQYTDADIHNLTAYLETLK